LAAATLRWKHPLSGDLSLVGSLEGDYVGTRTDADEMTSVYLSSRPSGDSEPVAWLIEV